MLFRSNLFIEFNLLPPLYIINEGFESSNLRSLIKEKVQIIKTFPFTDWEFSLYIAQSINLDLTVSKLIYYDIDSKKFLNKFKLILINKNNLQNNNLIKSSIENIIQENDSKESLDLKLFLIPLK